eukprot:365142-Chlamydomonas_euryale.AAC.10
MTRMLDILEDYCLFRCANQGRMKGSVNAGAGACMQQQAYKRMCTHRGGLLPLLVAADHQKSAGGCAGGCGKACRAAYMCEFMHAGK